MRLIKGNEMSGRLSRPWSGGSFYRMADRFVLIPKLPHGEMQ